MRARAIYDSARHLIQVQCDFKGNALPLAGDVAIVNGQKLRISDASRFQLTLDAPDATLAATAINEESMRDAPDVWLAYEGDDDDSGLFWGQPDVAPSVTLTTLENGRVQLAMSADVVPVGYATCLFRLNGVCHVDHTCARRLDRDSRLFLAALDRNTQLAGTPLEARIDAGPFAVNLEFAKTRPLTAEAARGHDFARCVRSAEEAAAIAVEEAREATRVHWAVPGRTSYPVGGVVVSGRTGLVQLRMYASDGGLLCALRRHYEQQPPLPAAEKDGDHILFVTALSPADSEDDLLYLLGNTRIGAVRYFWRPQAALNTNVLAEAFFIKLPTASPLRRDLVHMFRAFDYLAHQPALPYVTTVAMLDLTPNAVMPPHGMWIERRLDDPLMETQLQRLAQYANATTEGTCVSVRRADEDTPLAEVSVVRRDGDTTGSIQRVAVNADTALPSDLLRVDLDNLATPAQLRAWLANLRAHRGVRHLVVAGGTEPLYQRLTQWDLVQERALVAVSGRDTEVFLHAEATYSGLFALSRMDYAPDADAPIDADAPKDAHALCIWRDDASPTVWLVQAAASVSARFLRLMTPGAVPTLLLTAEGAGRERADEWIKWGGSDTSDPLDRLVAALQATAAAPSPSPPQEANDWTTAAAFRVQTWDTDGAPSILARIAKAHAARCKTLNHLPLVVAPLDTMLVGSLTDFCRHYTIPALE